MKHTAYREREAAKQIGTVFEIDANGQIWRIARGNNNGFGSYISIKRRRAEYLDNQGYSRINFLLNKKQHKVSASRLVWQHFFGDIPDGLELNHKNGIKTDNRPENLEVVTTAENVKHAVRTGLLKPNLGKNNGMAKLAVDDIIIIKEIYSSGAAYQYELAKMYDVCQATIYYVVNNITWQHINN